jgi:hypothetical protein
VDDSSELSFQLLGEASQRASRPRLHGAERNAERSQSSLHPATCVPSQAGS